MSMFDLKDKVVVITGGYGVLGASMARCLAEQGAHIVVVGRKADKGEAEQEKEMEAERLFHRQYGEGERKIPKAADFGDLHISGWWAVRDSNPRQSVCKTDTLPTELTARAFVSRGCGACCQGREGPAETLSAYRYFFDSSSASPGAREAFRARSPASPAMSASRSFSYSACQSCQRSFLFCM